MYKKKFEDSTPNARTASLTTQNIWLQNWYTHLQEGAYEGTIQETLLVDIVRDSDHFTYVFINSIRIVED